MEPTDLANPTRQLNWLFLIEDHVRLIVEAVDDILRPASERRLSRTKAHEQIAISKRNFKRLLLAASAKGTPLQVHDPDADPPSTDPTLNE